MAVIRPLSRPAARRYPRSRSSKYGPMTRPRPRPRSTVVSVPRQVGNGGFPETIITTLRYSDLIYIVSTAGGVGGNIYRLNSIFDPDYTGTGHQPLYFDQFATTYGRYSVLGSKIDVNFTGYTHDTDISPRGPWQIGLVGSNSATFASTPSALAESNKSVVTVLGRDKAGNNVKKLTMTYSPARDVGMPASDDTLGAAVGSNPNAPYYCYVYCADIEGTSSTVSLQVSIEYRVKFYLQGYTAQS